MYLGLGIVAASLMLLSKPVIVHAAGTGVSLTTSPVVLSLAVQPGSSDTRTLQLMNNSSQALKIDMKLNVFSASGDSGNATITDPLPNDPSTNYVSFSPTSFIAKPGVWSTVKMTIALPRNASLGYYYAVVFNPELPDQAAANTTNVHGSNAILVLVDTHSGDENRNIDISNFKVSQSLYEYLPASFAVSIANNGNIYTAPTGNIFISQSDDFSNTIAALDINPNAGNVLPHTNRDYTVNWSDGFPLVEDKKIDGQIITDSSGKPVKQLSWSFARFNKIRIGRYFAKVTVVYNDGKRVVPITRVVSFWVVPWKLMLVVVLTVGILVIGLLTIGRFILRPLKRPRVYRM